MRISLDTADPEEIKVANDALNAAGWQLDKATTNPTSMANAIKKYGETAKDIFYQIRDIGIREISIETLGTRDYDPSKMRADLFVEEAEAVFSWDPKTVKVKVPAVPEGIKAMKELSAEGIPVNATLIFQKEQAFWAAWAGAKYASPFVGRLDDFGENGMKLVESIVSLYSTQPFSTEVLTASMRNQEHIRQAFDAGSDIVTMPYNIFAKFDPAELGNYGKAGTDKRPQDACADHFAIGQMKKNHFSHTLISQGVQRFLDDARSVGYSVL